MNGLVQKSYASNNIIVGNPPVTVENMVADYRMLVAHNVPHTDQLISVEERTKRGVGIQTITLICCSFGPIGRTYQPRNLEEMLDALVCVVEVLVSVHSMGWMHRGIRCDNVFHAFENDDASNKKAFSKDFEFAARSPQQSFGKYTITTGNHAPEMFARKANTHSAAVDIWGLRYLIQIANINVALSHADDLQILMIACLEDDPEKRPKAEQCLETLRMLKR
jgi:serine/threonine protein kinase